MAIDEIIKSFDYIKHVGNGESTYEHCREEIALNEAVAIMRKYQQIEDIYYHQRGEALENSLRAVIEDGNVN